LLKAGITCNFIALKMTIHLIPAVIEVIPDINSKISDEEF